MDSREVLIEQLFQIIETNSPSTPKVIEFAQQNHIDVALVKNSDGRTLLHLAAGFGKINLIKHLISRGANVNARDHDGLVPIHNACNHGHHRSLTILIENGANVNLADNRGWTALHWALNKKLNADRIIDIYWKVIEILLNAGADPYHETNSGKSCFARIKIPEDRKNVRLIHLLTLLKSFNHDDPVRAATIDKYLSVEDYFEIVKIGDDKLHILTLLTTTRLLNSRLDSCDSITPLHRAAGYNHIELARFLIQKGARVSATDTFGRIPLHNAAQYGHVDMIDLLIEKKSDINKQDLTGYSPLHVAASNPTFTACKRLIELGASVNSRCLAGKLPYDLAESGDVKEVLRPDSMRQNPEVKTTILDESDPRYQMVKNEMLSTIVSHSNAKFSSYNILSIELVHNEKVRSKYDLECQKLEIDHGTGSMNERYLFHGSRFINNIRANGFDVRYAQSKGMFGAGIYFAEHSSKSNQYTFGCGQGCEEHMNQSCDICERMMIYAQVALGKSLISKEPMPGNAHAPPNYESVTGYPEYTEGLMYPEYIIYNSDRAYPLYVIRYKIIL